VAGWEHVVEVKRVLRVLWILRMLWILRIHRALPCAIVYALSGLLYTQNLPAACCHLLFASCLLKFASHLYLIPHVLSPAQFLPDGVQKRHVL